MKANNETQIKVTKLAKPEHHGDWHDKPTKWAVEGPGSELQKFSTKAEAMLYRRIRQKSTSFQEASRLYTTTY